MRIGISMYDGLGGLLFQHREAMGLTQEDLAQRSGLSVRAISDLERGRTRRPHRRSIHLLAAALDLSQLEVARFFDVRRDYTWSAAAGVGSRVHEEPVGRVLPRQLPMAARHFAGRGNELITLSALLGENACTAMISAICGPVGVGKTALAVHWAHQAASHFPDGQLFVNLRGFDPAPMAPAEAIRGFLEAFHLPPGRVPAGLDAQTALYRSLLAGKRVLIVLDNARDAEQVSPLLPGSAGCLVTVTSRSQLTSLVASHGARPITLDVLSACDARELLGRLLGPARVASEEEAAAELIEECNRLPLALSTAAARAAMCPSFPLSALVTQKRESQDEVRGGPGAATSRVADRAAARGLGSAGHRWLSGSDAGRRLHHGDYAMVMATPPRFLTHW